MENPYSTVTLDEGDFIPGDKETFRPVFRPKRTILF
jgi:hypothetical protein